MMMDGKDVSETLCPRCGTDGRWWFTDAEKTNVAVICPNCGRFEIPREEFDQAEVDISESGDGA